MSSSPSDWNPLFSTGAEVAASLTGLVFVAISINLKNVVSTPGLPARAAESVAHFFSILLLCMIMLVPGETPRALGAATLILGLATWIFISILQWRRFGLFPHSTRLVVGTVLGQVDELCIVFGGIRLVTNHADGYLWIAAAFALALIAGVLGAWVLLIEILR
jgi:modulator of FtsH protease